MRPSQIQIVNPEAHPSWRAYLRWMLETEPQRTWQMFLANQLQKYVDKKALKIQQHLLWLMREKGVPENQAEEIAMDQAMSREEEEQDQEEPLSEAQRRKVMNWVYDLPKKQKHPSKTTA
jgi:hypothetical protein